MGDISGTGKRTIEFRQHAGTCDANQILLWLRICHRLVVFSHEVSDSQLISLLRSVPDPDFAFTDLLTAMGGADLVSDAQPRVIIRAIPEQAVPQYDAAMYDRVCDLIRSRDARAREAEQVSIDAGQPQLKDMPRDALVDRGTWDHIYLPWDKAPWDQPGGTVAEDALLTEDAPLTEDAAYDDWRLEGRW